MIATIVHHHKEFRVDLSRPIDISLPLREGTNNVNAFYIPPVKMTPFKIGSFIGDVKQGGACNVFSIEFNPHGNGTHTETVGHISAEEYSVNRFLSRFFFTAQLISVTPEKNGVDFIITKDQLQNKVGEGTEALVIRTLPNSEEKKTAQYSGTNPPFMDPSAAEYLAELNIRHLILDIPSIDKEEDGGKLLAHHAFWKYPSATRSNCTITELAYIAPGIEDGHYLLNLMIASFDNDASPSKPVLYKFL